MRLDRRFLGYFTYFYTMLYAKMFHGYDILKHGNVPVKKGDDFLEEFGNERKELVEEEAFECPEYLPENGEYVITVFVGEDKVCEKVI